MSDESQISITVWLSGRSYRIRIKPDEEEIVRRAVKLADQKIQDMKQHYAGKDDQDFIAMCLLSYAADGAIEGNSYNPLVVADVNRMVEKIDDILNEE